MTLDERQQVHELLGRTLEQPPANRSRFLLTADASPMVRARVESLLMQGETDVEEERLPAAREPITTAIEEGSDTGGIVAERYELERELGRGGTSVVYFAHDRHLPNRRCVVKILNEASAHPALFAKKFQEEIDAQVLLEGREGIVTISDKGQLPDGRPYFVMQYVEGATLRAELENGPMPFDRVAQIVRQIGHALRFAHQKGICHLDLKPGNIMLQDVDTSAVRVWVIDFGAAKIASTVLKPLTTTRTPLGTPAYMAPEQHMGRMSPACDVYALGVIAFEMLTGARPDDDDRKQLERLKAGKTPGDLKYPLPTTTQRLLAQGLAPAPSQRPADVASFAEDLSESLSPQLPVPIVVNKERSTLRRYAGIGIAATVLAVGLAALWFIRQVGTPPRLTVEQLTSYPGSEGYPSLSPDGSQVAFVWGGPDNSNIDIYVQRLAQGPSLRLTTNAAIDSLPAWSPDGALIAFVRYADEATVYLTSPVPGAERKLAVLRPTTKLLYVMNVSWSPDGKWLATDGWDTKGPGIVLLRVADGAQRGLISNAAAEGSYCYPVFSPTGKWIAYAHCQGKDGLTGDSDPCDIHVLRLDENYSPQGPPRQLTRHGSAIRGISWAPDERSVVYGASIGGDTRLWRVPLSGAPPERLEGTFRGTFPTTSRSGGKLVYTHEYSDDWDIWKLQVNGPPLRVLSSTRNDYDPQLSPNGDKVAFVTNRAGRGREIWVAALDGTSAIPLALSSGREAGSPRWSPDGRWIAFDAQSEKSGSWDIYVIDAAGGQPRRLTNHPGFENFPSWSRDGNWIYFRSMRSGRSEVWRIPSMGGEPVQMTTTGGASAWESWDGETLYYTRHDGLGPDGVGTPLFARSLRGGSERLVLDEVLAWNFFPVKDGIYFVMPPVDNGQDSLELRFLNAATGKSKLVMKFPVVTGQGLSVSADGKTILYSGRPPGVGADLMLIDNFR